MFVGEGEQTAAAAAADDDDAACDSLSPARTLAHTCALQELDCRNEDVCVVNGTLFSLQSVNVEVRREREREQERIRSDGNVHGLTSFVITVIFLNFTPRTLAGI